MSALTRTVRLWIRSTHLIKTRRSTYMPRTPTVATEELEIGDATLCFESGKVAYFTNAAVTASIGETKVLSTVCSSRGDPAKDFLPLIVDYRDRSTSDVNTRVSSPSDPDLVSGRLIDRCIRALFPAGYRDNIHVMTTCLSTGDHDDLVIAANAASAALILSDLPWRGPVGVVRLARVDGQIVSMPTADQLKSSDIDLVYACTTKETLMIDLQAREVPDVDLGVLLRKAHSEAVKIIHPQRKLASVVGKFTKRYHINEVPRSIMDKTQTFALVSIEELYSDNSLDKFERANELYSVLQNLRRLNDIGLKSTQRKEIDVVKKSFEGLRDQVVRKQVLENLYRIDARQTNEVRKVCCELGSLPGFQGSSIFSRGESQVLSTVSVGEPIVSSRGSSPAQRFTLHYSFPPFCTNDTSKGDSRRRVVGHGTLAAKALLSVLPPEDMFPYVVRVDSEIMASQGSTSMATVSGGSLALMDGGFPLRTHVAGVSIGLITEVVRGQIVKYKILTDILGLEDHIGDMDFKVAGTRKGVTALQLDTKHVGVSLDIIIESLEAAQKGRICVIESMEKTIGAPREQVNGNTQWIVTWKYNSDSLHHLGQFENQKIRIEEQTGTRIFINDGVLTLLARDKEILQKAQDLINKSEIAFSLQQGPYVWPCKDISQCQLE